MDDAGSAACAQRPPPPLVRVVGFTSGGEGGRGRHDTAASPLAVSSSPLTRRLRDAAAHSPAPDKRGGDGDAAGTPRGTPGGSGDDSAGPAGSHGSGSSSDEADTGAREERSERRASLGGSLPMCIPLAADRRRPYQLQRFSVARGVEWAI